MVARSGAAVGRSTLRPARQYSRCGRTSNVHKQRLSIAGAARSSTESVYARGRRRPFTRCPERRRPHADAPASGTTGARYAIARRSMVADRQGASRRCHQQLPRDATRTNADVEASRTRTDDEIVINT